MTTAVVTDEQLGKLSRRMHDLYERVRNGGVDFQATMNGLQLLAESELIPENQNTPDSNKKSIEKWQKFYQKVFGETFDFSGVRIPEKPKGDWWLVIVAKGMKPQRLFMKCQEKFGAWKWTEDDLDKIVTSDRTADDGHYVIWVRANVEADPEFKNLSANKLKVSHKGITLEERLVLELFYWWKTKKHLDIGNWTLCSGSRYFDGRVPSVHWDDGELKVDWNNPGGADDALRSREAVS